MRCRSRACSAWQQPGTDALRLERAPSARGPGGAARSPREVVAPAEEVGGRDPALRALRGGRRSPCGTRPPARPGPRAARRGPPPPPGTATEASRRMPSSTIAFSGRLTSTPTPAARGDARARSAPVRAVVPLQDGARLEEVQRELQDAEVVVRARPLAGRVQHARERRRLGIVRGARARCWRRRRSSGCGRPRTCASRKREGRAPGGGRTPRGAARACRGCARGRRIRKYSGLWSRQHVERLELQARPASGRAGRPGTRDGCSARRPRRTSPRPGRAGRPPRAPGRSSRFWPCT